MVTVGRSLVCDRVRGESSVAAIGWFAIGTGSTAVAATDTTLVTEVWRAAVTKMLTANGVLTVVYFLPATAANGNTLAEAGIFNAASGGTLLTRATHSAEAKTSTKTITYTWTITLTAS